MVDERLMPRPASCRPGGCRDREAACHDQAVVIGPPAGSAKPSWRNSAPGATFDTVYALSRSGSPLPGATEAGRIDLMEEASIRAAAAQVGDDHRPVDLILVASGQLHGPAITPEKALKTLDPAAMATLFAVNATGPALVAKHFVPLLSRARGGASSRRSRPGSDRSATIVWGAGTATAPRRRP